MLLTGLQTCLELTELAEILQDKPKHRKCPMFEKNSFSLPHKAELRLRKCWKPGMK